MIAEQLRKAILQAAMQGKLTEQLPSDGDARDLLTQISKEKQKLKKEGKIKKEKPLEQISDSAILFDIPRNWVLAPIGCILSMRAGKNISSAEIKSSVDSMHRFPCVGGNGIRGFVKQYNTEGEHVVVGRQGALCGNINFINGQFYATEHAVVVTSLIASMETKFIGLFLTALNLNQYATATAQPGLAVSKILLTPFPLPPLAEQKRIVERIDELMKKIEEIEKPEMELFGLNKAFPDSMRNSLLQAAVQGKLTEQLPSDGDARDLLTQISKEKQKLIKEGKIKKEKTSKSITEDEIPFEIPVNWTWCRLGFISSYSEQKLKINSTQAGNNLWLLDLEDIEKGGRLLAVKRVFESSAIGDKTLFDKGMVLYSKLRPYLKKILIAPEAGICTPEIVPFALYGSIYTTFIVQVLKSPFVDSYINSVTYGVKMPRVGTDTMNSLLIPLPPLAEQKRIVERLVKLLPLCDELTEEKG